MTSPHLFQARIKDFDNDRFLASLFAPEAVRGDLWTLYAFNLELSKIRETVSEPLIGRMRLQFWRDALATIRETGAAPAHEVATPLAEIVARHPQIADDLNALIDARETDLDDVPPAHMAAFEDYAAGTSATLIAAAMRVLGGAPERHEEAIRHAGIAIAAVGVVRALPYQIALGQVTVPADVCRAAGLDPSQPGQWPQDLDLKILTRELIAVADAHTQGMRRASKGLARAVVPAFLPFSLSALYLKRLKASGGDPVHLVANPVGVGRPLTVFVRAVIGRP